MACFHRSKSHAVQLRRQADEFPERFDRDDGLIESKD